MLQVVQLTRRQERVCSARLFLIAAFVQLQTGKQGPA